MIKVTSYARQPGDEFNKVQVKAFADTKEEVTAEATLTIGTAVTSASSSVTGFYEDSVYINKTTWDVWKCTGTAWALQGNIKGATGATGANGVSPAVTIGTITGGHSVKITDATHPSGQTFNVMDGAHAVYGSGHTIYIS